MKKIVFVLLAILVLASCTPNEAGQEYTETEIEKEYTGEPYVVVNENVPYFTESDYTTTSYESYSELDSLGRCGPAMACIGTDLMPTEKRGEIGQIKPSGWQTIKVNGQYLYNRCHLIGYQLSGENANEKNLITGTRYMNVDGMLPFENMVADYVKETENHVLYRVTPVFDGTNLVASGVLMEAESMEDNGEGIEFCVYCYNVEPDVEIDYSGGSATSQAYVLNTKTKKFHLSTCSSVSSISDENCETYSGSREDLINQGYKPCKSCDP